MSEDVKDENAGRQPSGGLNPETVKYIVERAESIKSYSNKLRAATEEISDYLNKIREQSGIVYVSSHMISREFGEHPPLDENYLAVSIYGLSLVYPAPGCKGLVLIAGDEYKYHKQYVDRFSRDELIETARVLPQFLREYAQKLQNSEAEIQEFADKAERILAILSD